VGLVLARRAAGAFAMRLAGSPRDASGLPPQQNVAHRLYDRVMCFTRYRIGRFAPAIGPQTLFVAARAA
jgi:hypothetical protein